ncbi:glutathione synthase [Gulbenkiania indica]|uniref:Glutathione synthetase n=1 Tax=Gulbenkiania indica TaxID=375574 RepID=A0A0K6GY73_9NEIS|nr:glutathione synthase [Gulbenkiania indica]CUA83687.1 glutathione synthase [Gulbenkiania indica]
MRILFIADPLEQFKIYKDTTFAMMEAAAARGHAISVCQARHLSVESGRVLADTRLVTLTGNKDAWFRLADAERHPLFAFDAVLMRKDPPFDLEYLYATQLLTLAESQGAHVFNSGQVMRDFNEKLAILNFPELTAPTLVTGESARLRAFVRQHQDVILKPLDSMGGDSIFRVKPDDPNLSVIIETITLHGTRTVMAQRYIPEIREGDKRILIIGGKPVDHCLARVPLAGETRGNLAAGGRGEARPLTARDREIAETIGPELKKRGVLFAGADVIGNYLTEINITSPTCFREIMDQTGIDVAGLFIAALEEACAR